MYELRSSSTRKTQRRSRGKSGHTQSNDEHSRQGSSNGIHKFEDAFGHRTSGCHRSSHFYQKQYFGDKVRKRRHSNTDSNQPQTIALLNATASSVDESTQRPKQCSAADASCTKGVHGPSKKRRRRSSSSDNFDSGSRRSVVKMCSNKNVEYNSIATIPRDIFEVVTASLDYSDLCSLECASKTLKNRLTVKDGGFCCSDRGSGSCTCSHSDVNGNNERWKQLVLDRWTYVNSLPAESDEKHLNETLKRAVRYFDNSWKDLFAAKFLASKKSAPWCSPCDAEVFALLDRVMSMSDAGCGLNVIFLVDGSGSVTEEDFNSIRAFLIKAAKHMHGNRNGAKHSTNALTSDDVNDVNLSIVQFTNEVRTEAKLSHYGDEGWSETVRNIKRMNGGTNIAAAVRQSGQILRNHYTQSNNNGAGNVVVLISDGRVDSFQGDEAALCAESMANEFGTKNSRICFYYIGQWYGIDDPVS